MSGKDCWCVWCAGFHNTAIGDEPSAVKVLPKANARASPPLSIISQPYFTQIDSAVRYVENTSVKMQRNILNAMLPFQFVQFL